MSESQYLGVFSKEFLKYLQDLFVVYLVEHKYQEIVRILAAPNTMAYYSVAVSFADLIGYSSTLADCLRHRYAQTAPVLKRSLIAAQEQLMEAEETRMKADKAADTDDLTTSPFFGLHVSVSVKRAVNVRLHDFPERDFLRHFVPTEDDCGFLVAFRGIVMRASETQQTTRCYAFQCQRCAALVSVATRFETSYAESAPSSCNNAACDSSQFVRIDAERLSRAANRNSASVNSRRESEECAFRDVRELRVQEKRDDRRRLVPNSITVVLEDDLVDLSLEPGDEVEVCGVVVRRFVSVPTRANPSSVNELVLRATQVRALNGDNHFNATPCSAAMRARFACFWKRYANEPFRARQLIVSSICPSLRGLNIVKLALALVLAGGNLNANSPGAAAKRAPEESAAEASSNLLIDVTNANAQRNNESVKQKQNSNTHRSRGDCHLLLVGDAGTGKSEFLAFARAVVPHAVLVSGTALSSAGLTVSASGDRSSGAPQLEAGALVHADGSVCCIDEFAYIKQTDQAALLQAMEEQIVYFDKAGATSKMNARCSVIAATNPRGSYRLTENLTVNTGLSGPLISRFDLVFVILDLVKSDWDQVVADRIVDICTETTSELPDNETRENDVTEPERTEEEHESSIAIIEPAEPSLSDMERTWTLDELRAFFMHIRTSRPAWRNADAHLVIQSYFEECRTKMGSDVLSSDRRTPRLFMSLMRLAEAHARLLSPGRTSCEVLLEDAVCAVCLMDSSIQSCAIRKPDPLTGLVDTSAANSILLSEQTPIGAANEYRRQATVVLTRLGLTGLLEKELRRLDLLEAKGRLAAIIETDAEEPSSIVDDDEPADLPVDAE